MASSKSKECTCQKDNGGYWLGICESTLKNVHIKKISLLNNSQFTYVSQGSNKPFEQRGTAEKSLASSKQ